MQEKDCSGFIPSHAMCEYEEVLFTQTHNFLMLPCSFFFPQAWVCLAVQFFSHLLVLLFNLHIGLTGLSPLGQIWVDTLVVSLSS